MNEFKIKISIEGIKELTEAVLALAGAGIESGQAVPAETALVQPASAPVQQMPTSAQQTAMPVQQMAAPMQQAQPWNMPAPGTSPQGYGQPPQQQGMAMGAGMQPLPGQAGVLPTTAVPQEYTIEQLQVAAAGLSSMGKMPQVVGILKQFGIQAMTELPRERYGEFAIALREAGAQI